MPTTTYMLTSPIVSHPEKYAIRTLRGERRAAAAVAHNQTEAQQIHDSGGFWCFLDASNLYRCSCYGVGGMGVGGPQSMHGSPDPGHI